MTFTTLEWVLFALVEVEFWFFFWVINRHAERFSCSAHAQVSDNE